MSFRPPAWLRNNNPRRSSTTSSAPNRRRSTGPPAQPSYSAATSAGRSTISPGYSNTPGVNQSVRDEYWGFADPTNSRTTSEYLGYRAGRAAGGPALGAPVMPSYSGGGGGGYGGGGGGGGGGAALTQAMFDSMLRALGTTGPGLTLQQLQLPAFQGQNLPAFNAAPYTTATADLSTAVTADQAAAAAAATQAQQALAANYTNAYANTPVQNTPAAQQVGAALQGTVGGGGNQADVAAQSNAAGASDQASFANLLGVLAAADQTSQASRLNQVQLDKGTAMRNIAAQRLGLQGGINMARTQAQNQWAQADAERRYQNSLMQQQWQREALMRNQDINNQQAQGNWQQQNEMISNRLPPLLQLLQGTAGTNLNASALQQLLAGWSR